MKFRYSGINTYLECPKKFKQIYVDNIVETQESIDLHFGTAMHSALQAHYEGNDPYDVFNMYWNSLLSKHLESARFNWDQLREMAVDTFIPNFIRLHAKKLDIIKLEETIEMPFIGSHSLTGTFDVVAKVDGKLTLLDYKTSAREYPIGKIYKNPQLYIYAKLYESKYGTPIEQIMYKVFIKTEKRIQTVKLDLQKERLDRMISNVEVICRDIVRRVETNEWYSNPNCYCINKECTG